MARGVSMPQIVSGLARLMPGVSRFVVDGTGLTGRFDIELKWTPTVVEFPRLNDPELIAQVPPIDPNGPSLFTAVQEQLGLKLDSQKGPVEMLVIDSLRHPTPDK